MKKICLKTALLCASLLCTPHAFAASLGRALRIARVASRSGDFSTREIYYIIFAVIVLGVVYDKVLKKKDNDVPKRIQKSSKKSNMFLSENSDENLTKNLSENSSEKSSKILSEKSSEDLSENSSERNVRKGKRSFLFRNKGWSVLLFVFVVLLLFCILAGSKDADKSRNEERPTEAYRFRNDQRSEEISALKEDVRESLERSEEILRERIGKRLEETLRNDFKSNAEQGEALAQVQYGLFLKNGKNQAQDDMIEAVEWFRKAADQGCPEAFYELAVCYENGEGLDQNLDEAEVWYRKALLDPASATLNPCSLPFDENVFIAERAQQALDRIASLKTMENSGEKSE